MNTSGIDPLGNSNKCYTCAKLTMRTKYLIIDNQSTETQEIIRHIRQSSNDTKRTRLSTYEFLNPYTKRTSQSGKVNLRTAFSKRKPRAFEALIATSRKQVRKQFLKRVCYEDCCCYEHRACKQSQSRRQEVNR